MRKVIAATATEDLKLEAPNELKINLGAILPHVTHARRGLSCFFFFSLCKPTIHCLQVDRNLVE
jgi:hypothetical protein